MKKNMYVTLLLVILGGCAVPNTFQMYDYQRSGIERYPSISVLVNDGYVYADTGCSQYGCYTYVDKVNLFFIDALRETNRFERVDTNNPYSERKLVIKFTSHSMGSEGVSFAKAMVSIISLSLIPVSRTVIYEAEISLIERDKVVDSYKYKRESEERSFLFNDLQDYKNNAIKSMVSNFVHDLEKNGTFDASKKGLISLREKSVFDNRYVLGQHYGVQ